MSATSEDRGPDRPLFAQVGRASGTTTDPRTRTFHLVIAIGLLVSAGALLTELGERGRWTTVRVTLEGPALDPERAPDQERAPPP